MIIGTTRELKNQEFRVGLTPDNVSAFVNGGHTVLVEAGAGEGAGFTDAEYAEAGAKLIANAEEVWAQADMIVKVKEPEECEYERMREGQILYTYLHLAPNPSLTDALVERKVKAGCEFFQTQAVFEPEKFASFMERASQFGVPVQLGVIIPKSAGMCRFLNNNVAGIHVPDEMLEKLSADKERAKAGITGVEIAAQVIRECRPYCQGVHIMALGWESKVPALLEQAGITA